jgi:hypothetical protein
MSKLPTVDMKFKLTRQCYAFVGVSLLSMVDFKYPPFLWCWRLYLEHARQALYH